MRVSFWNNNHPLTPLADQMQERFIPRIGATSYVESEVFRSVLRLHHDYFNNGFGNNMCHPVEYVEKYYLAKASPKFCEAFREIREQAMAPTGDDSLDDYFDTVMSEVIEHLARVADADALTAIREQMFDMPYTETVFPADEDDTEEYY